MRPAAVGAVMLVLFLSFAAPVLAFTPRAGSSVVVSQPLADDLYATGGTVEVTAPVDGDIVAAGGTLTLSGPTTGGILAAGGTISVRGRAGRTIRAAGGRVTLGAPVGEDAVLAGGTITVEEGAEIGRDLVIAGGRIEVAGAVGDDAYLTGGTIMLGGTIQGSVEAHGDRIVLLPGARIAGTLRYSADDDVELQPGAQVAGEITRVQRPVRSRTLFDPAARTRFRFAGRVLEAFWLFVIGLVLVAVTPQGVRHVAGDVGRRFGWSLLTGFILLVVVPAAALLLVFTIIGIPAAFIILLLYAATLYPAQIFTATWLGETMLRPVRGGMSIYLSLALGVLVLVILVALPFIGWLVRLLALLVGFGALWAALWRARTRPAPSTPTGV